MRHRVQMKRHEALDTIAAAPQARTITSVQVEATCCLSVARRLGGEACLLCMGSQTLSFTGRRGTQLHKISGSTTLRAVLKHHSDDYTLPPPRLGGIYVPDVLILDDDNGGAYGYGYRPGTSEATRLIGSESYP